MFSFRSFFTSLFPFLNPAPAPIVRFNTDDTDINGASWVNASSATDMQIIDLTRSTVLVSGRVVATSGRNHVQGGSGDDYIWGNSSANRLQGGDGNDILNGRDGADTLMGDTGNDELYGGVGDDSLAGGKGNDLLDGGYGADTMRGGAGDDIYYVDHMADLVFEDNDNGYDVVRASGNYTLQSGQSIERLEAADSSSTDRHNLVGNALRQLIVGGAGDDTLDGAGGGDTLIGGRGNDRYIVYSSSDTVTEYSGEGYDTVVVRGDSYRLASGAEIERVELQPTSNVKDIFGQIIRVSGNEFSQVIVGNGLDNVIDGGGGNDTLSGGDPTGGAGVLAFMMPMLYGDYDTFRFSTPLGSDNVDRILDFNNKIDFVTGAIAVLGMASVESYRGHDTIELSKSIFSQLPVGNLSASAFCQLDTQTVTTDHRILYAANTGSLFYDPDGSGSALAIKFAELNAHQSLNFSSFVVSA